MVLDISGNLNYKLYAFYMGWTNYTGEMRMAKLSVIRLKNYLFLLNCIALFYLVPQGYTIRSGPSLSSSMNGCNSGGGEMVILSVNIESAFLF